MDYKELSEQLRYCGDVGKCQSCKFYMETEPCSQNLLGEAADAIEELMRRNNNQMEYVQEALGKKYSIIEEVARRDATDGTIKVFSGKEIIEIVEKVWRN